MTLGARNGDLALTAGNAYRLTALGAVEITVIAVLQAVEKLQESAVLLIALVCIAGQAAEDRRKHQHIA